jgi:uncharacterized protein YprB with RNaseH-like and TPR domain/predicted nuclease with RNAse H fold
MIKNTFLFIPKVGKKTEEGFWKKDILVWDDLASSIERVFPDAARQDEVRHCLSRAQEALDRKDAAFFAQHLPPHAHWRIYREFREKTVFLDIETTGLSPYYDTITLIGTFDGTTAKIFVKDTNLDEIGSYLEKFEIIVTFNGKLFDIPFIRKFFPDISIPPVHIDLRFLLKSLGFSGPLKRTERTLGITRDTEIRDIDGRQAVVLWNRFVKGDDDALKYLVRYNITDTINLKELMDFCYLKKMEEGILPGLKDSRALQALTAGSEPNLTEELYPDSGIGAYVVIPDVTVNRTERGIGILLNNRETVAVKRTLIHGTGVAITHLLDRITGAGKNPVSVGIDLTGSEARGSGICVLRGNDAFLRILNTDEEIIQAVTIAAPSVIAIDSSLGLPTGRCCTEDSCECRRFGIMRECERELRRRGIHVYPCLIPSMQKLTQRGMKLSKILRDSGFTVIESYPGAAQDILGFPRKRVHLRELAVDLLSMGIVPHSDREPVTHDQIDALTNAANGYFFLAGMYEAIGNEEEGFLILPKPEMI